MQKKKTDTTEKYRFKVTGRFISEFDNLFSVDVEKVEQVLDNVYDVWINTHENNHFWLSTGTHEQILGTKWYDNINVIVVNAPDEYKL